MAGKKKKRASCVRLYLDDPAVQALGMAQQSIGAATTSEAARYSLRRVGEILRMVADGAQIRVSFPDGRTDMVLDFPTARPACGPVLQPPIVIGFGSKQHRGKDTAARYAADRLTQLKMASRLDSFAASLKQGIGQGVFGLSMEQLHEPDVKVAVDPFWDMSPRRILQLAGTEAMQVTFGRDVWCKTLLRRAAARPDVSVLICDVRFPHEAEAVHALGGAVVRVDRAIKRPDTWEEHVSETALDDYDSWDYVVDNNGSLAHLRKLVTQIVDLECQRQAKVGSA